MIERILLILKIKNLSPSKFADEIGVLRSSISHIMAGRNKPSVDFLVKILNRFPDISSDWLILGKGQMLKTQQIDLFTENTSQNADTSVLKNDEVNKTLFHTEGDDLVTEDVEIADESESNDNENKKKENFTFPSTDSSEAESEKVTNALSIEEAESIVIFYKNKTFRVYYPA